MTEPGAGDTPVTQEHIDTPPLYRDLLANARDSRNRSISDDIREIDISEFIEIADMLQREQSDDHEKRERSRAIYITPQGQFIAQEESTIGGINHVELEIEPSLLGFDDDSVIRLGSTDSNDPNLNQPAIALHAHQIDVPPSPPDLAQQLSAHPLSPISSLVVTPEKYYIVFRGEKTSRLDSETILEKGELWRDQVIERFNDLRSRDPEMDILKATSLEFRLNKAMARQIAAKYDLRIFVAPKGESVAHLVSPQEL